MKKRGPFFFYLFSSFLLTLSTLGAPFGSVGLGFSWPVVQSDHLHRSSVGRWFSRPTYTGVQLAQIHRGSFGRCSVGTVTPGFSWPVFQSAWDSVGRRPVGPVTPGFTWPEVQSTQLPRGSLGRCSVGRVTPGFICPVVQSAQLHPGSDCPWFSRPRNTGVQSARSSVGPDTPGFTRPGFSRPS